MLKLAAAAFGKMTAWRVGTVRTGFQECVGLIEIPRRSQRYMTPAFGYAIPLACKSDDMFAHRHSPPARER